MQAAGIASRRGITADELFRLAGAGRYELIAGSLREMSPTGGRHGRVANRIAWHLSNHLERQHLGVVFAAETGFLIAQAPDTVLAADVAFVSRARFDSVGDESKYLPLAPELVVEVVSPSDTFTSVEAKAFQWLDAGCRLVLLADPEGRTVHAYRSRSQIHVLEESDLLDAGDVVAGWQVPVREFFRVY